MQRSRWDHKYKFYRLLICPTKLNKNRFSMMMFALQMSLVFSLAVGKFQTMETSNFGRIPSDFVSQGALANPNQIHEVYFSINSQNYDKFKLNLDKIANPMGSNYRKYMNRQEISDYLNKGPAMKFTKSFLLSHGVDEVNPSRFSDFIVAKAPISTWELMFDAQFYEFTFLKGRNKGQTIFRSLSYSLPVDLIPHVSFVMNTVQIPIHFKHPTPRITQISSSPSSLKTKYSQIIRKLANSDTTPAFLNTYYSISNNTGSLLASQAVYESLNQSASPKDLSSFQTYFSLPQDAIDTVIGGHVSNSACQPDVDNCAEANLDIQYLMAVSQITPTTYFYDNSDDFLLTWAVEVADMTDPPLVWSISYGEDEAYLSHSYLKSFDQSALVLLSMGVTIIASSGDDGALPGGISSSRQCSYAPSYPASSPYVTAVGATQGPEYGSPEIVCQSNHNPSGVITSGGGFSSFYPAPSWQTDQIANYFNSLTTQPVSGYNKNGRGYPDVTLIGSNYEVFLDGSRYLMYGTSASSPVFAGFVSLVNSILLAQGQAPVGWINPSLYPFATQILKIDITSGSNKCGVQDSNGNQICCTQGFKAAPGWDPTSGIGSINYDLFKDLFVQLAYGNVSLPPSIAPSASPTTPTSFPSIHPSAPTSFPSAHPLTLSPSFPSPSSSSSSSSSSPSLPIGVVAAIAIAVIGGAALLVVGGVFCYYRSRTHSHALAKSAENDTDL